MSANQTSTPDDLGPYPYVPTIWNDGSGSLGIYWTLTTSTAAIVSALIAIVIQFTISRLATLLNTVLYISFIRKRSTSILDDQVNTVAVNNTSAVGRWSAIFTFARVSRRKALSSVPLIILAISASVLLALQGISILFIGSLFSHGPVPMTVGKCGLPSSQSLADSKTQAEHAANDARLRVHRQKIFQDAATRFAQCTEGTNNMVCPGPVGQNFSWEIFESDPSYCWFGKEHCLNDSNARTILQRAMITPRDMATTRNSRVALSYITECSYLDNTDLMKAEIFDGNYSTWSYEYGQSEDFTQHPPTVEPNVIVVQDSENNTFQYSLELFSSPQTWNSRSLAWIPPAFLSDNLNRTSFLNGSTSLEYQPFRGAVTLVFNAILGVYASIPYTDPFFSATLNTSTADLYAPNYVATTMVCRDHLQYHIRPKDNHYPEQYTADDILDIGNNSQMSFSTNIYSDAIDLAADFDLLSTIATPPMASISQLQGSALRAATYVDQAGVQRGDPKIISGRAEQIRWFAIDMLAKLYMAQTITGTENDWGDGVDPFYLPPAENDSSTPQLHWVCRNTLRIAPEYQSLNFIAFIIILALSTFIIGMSYAIQPTLSFGMRYFSKTRRNQSILQAILSLRLHDLLQIHRIAVEKTYGVRFRGTTDDVPVPDSTESPFYGVMCTDESMEDVMWEGHLPIKEFEGISMDLPAALTDLTTDLTSSDLNNLTADLTTDPTIRTTEDHNTSQQRFLVEPEAFAVEEVPRAIVTSAEEESKEEDIQERELYATMLQKWEAVDYYDLKKIR
jgi:hypothetical protein